MGLSGYYPLDRARPLILGVGQRQRASCQGGEK
jgi:hypothetical protein